jgi:hypothetical protein
MKPGMLHTVGQGKPNFLRGKESHGDLQQPQRYDNGWLTYSEDVALDGTDHRGREWH